MLRQPSAVDLALRLPLPLPLRLLGRGLALIQLRQDAFQNQLVVIVEGLFRLAAEHRALQAGDHVLQLADPRVAGLKLLPLPFGIGLRIQGSGAKRLDHGLEGLGVVREIGIIQHGSSKADSNARRIKKTPIESNKLSNPGLCLFRRRYEGICLLFGRFANAPQPPRPAPVEARKQLVELRPAERNRALLGCGPRE